MTEVQKMQVLRIKTVCALLGISKSKLYEFYAVKSPRYDPSFPERIRLGGRAVGILESALHEWIKEKQIKHSVGRT